MQQHTAIIIGSGFGGQAAAINLRRIGIEDFLILERRAWMGGTWSQNSYPGAAVDVQSPLYSLSFEPYQWSQMFAEQDELVEYTNHVLAKHGLREKTKLHANVTKVQWDEASQTWQVQLEGGEVLGAKYLINASGPLSTPVIPHFKGRDTFQGKTFHTNNWQHGYDHKGKRVAIIGSGASAAQVIPAIAPEVQTLHVFQRTPHWVLPRPDRVFSKFERALLGNKLIYKALRTAIYWGLESRVIGFKYSKKMLNVVAQQAALKHIAKQISDPALRQAVTPDYTIGCKRIILSSTLYPALCRPNVKLHPKDDGIAEINARGILTTQGQQIDLDLIVYSTGYDATDGVISYPVVGKGGQSVQDVWAEFPRAYLGTTLPGFPNFFVVTGPNTGIGHTSAIFVIEAQMEYIRRAIQAVQRQGAKTIEVKPQAEADYTTMIHREMKQTVWQSGGCTSWYKSKSGHVIAMFPGFSFTFRQMAKAFKPGDHVIV
ncbi:cation diffusion facilitator CzcD-associated flavoprotein CzcO [Aquabacterium commune]|uniref:Cation diffusion facilitator CzcD-associated flavoprotein CzcO n=1 Tax=Aquabacterium commune TaxID=70586 RepID=A0A4R6RHI1_9BURK|nr:NAD(P)/FAD-dependent oxidoreductase [Aquabacterium commune]TDP85899.1 cation diffusion facilitator CzcD-associated flavoprotein CzcO [Aquabacterium commune]